jgi:hypothetical protein
MSFRKKTSLGYDTLPRQMLFTAGYHVIL